MAAEERTLGQLVSDASRDVSELVRYEIALAKSEVQRDAKRVATGSAVFVVALALVLYSFVALLIAVALVIAIWLPAWAAFLIVFAVLVLAAAGFVLYGVRQFKRVKPPERTIRSTKETIAAVRNRGGDGASTAAPGS
jgi:uncharacterized membrane protein YqjE